MSFVIQNQDKAPEEYVNVELVSGQSLRDQLAPYAGSGSGHDFIWKYVMEVVEINEIYDEEDVWAGRILLVPDRRTLEQRTALVVDVIL